MYPALTVGHGDIAEATNAEISSLDGDVGATWLGTLAGCGRSVSEERDLVREREEIWCTQHLTIYPFIYIPVICEQITNIDRQESKKNSFVLQETAASIPIFCSNC